jgi:hypothetical protein
MIDHEGLKPLSSCGFGGLCWWVVGWIRWDAAGCWHWQLGRVLASRIGSEDQMGRVGVAPAPPVPKSEVPK